MPILISWLIIALPVAALLIFSLEALLGVRKLKPVRVTGQMPMTRILIPAHDEAGTIETTLARLGEVVSESVRLLVVADNCSDATATLVAQAGQEVIERFDPDKRGKGYALAFGRDHLRADPPECVLILDADCEIDAASIEALAKVSMARNSVVQSRYVFKADRSASPRVQLSNFAFWIKNVVRQRGAHRLGAAAVLAGTGMAFPWHSIEDAPLATAEIVEDLALGAYLTRIGRPPIYLDQALVESVAATEQATLAQRTRWEVGFVTIARSFGLRALVDGIKTGNRKLFLLGLHMMVPPLALLMLVAFAISVAVAIVAWITGQWAPLAAIACALTLAAMCILLNWGVGGYRWLGLAALVRIPLYIIWKLPVYLRLLRGEKIGWTRTQRAAPSDGGAAE